MTAEEFVKKIKTFGNREAIICKDLICTFNDLNSRSQQWGKRLVKRGIREGSVVCLLGDYGPESVSLLLALMKNHNIIVPITLDSLPQKEKFFEIAEVEWEIDLTNQSFACKGTGTNAAHPIYDDLRKWDHPGVVLFSSGSTGEPKAAVHDLNRILTRYEKPGKSYRTLVFLQMDHIGGINTLLYTLSNGGTIVIPSFRSPEEVSRAIEKHRVELLPTSPTFLNLLLLSGAYANYDLSSLKLITYGTEPMPQATLERVRKALPGVRLKQTYGLSEVGILHSRSKDNESLWIKLGGGGFKTKIINGRLWIKSESAMLGYLNAPSPFDDEGYFDTGDLVEEDGEWIRVLGRESELINVGGNKVFPAEVENILMQMDEVEDVLVYGEPNLITGSTVSAVIKLRKQMPLSEFKTKMRLFCKGKLEPYKIPMKIKTTQESLYSVRYKKDRKKKESENLGKMA